MEGRKAIQERGLQDMVCLLAQSLGLSCAITPVLACKSLSQSSFNSTGVNSTSLNIDVAVGMSYGILPPLDLPSDRLPHILPSLKYCALWKVHLYASSRRLAPLIQDCEEPPFRHLRYFLSPPAFLVEATWSALLLEGCFAERATGGLL